MNFKSLSRTVSFLFESDQTKTSQEHTEYWPEVCLLLSLEIAKKEDFHVAHLNKDIIS